MRPPRAFPLYGALASAAVSCALAPWARLRGDARIAERLGRAVLPAPALPRLLVHAVSVGEMAAAGALLQALAERTTGWSAVLTSSTREGFALADHVRARVPAVEACVALPWDRPAIVEWLRRTQPSAVVVIETEIWPALFLGCGTLGIPLLLASGRIYPRDRAGYRLLGGFLRRVLEAPRWIGVQDEDQRQAFVALGAPPERTHVAGNLKQDAIPLVDLPAAHAEALATTPVLLGASTHAPEEGLLVEAFTALRTSHPALRLVIAPRHPARAGDVMRDVARRHLRVARWAEALREPWDVLVVDEVGVLPALYGTAALTFVGGSLAPRGGHNPLEPAAAGCPILIGPHTEHFPREVLALRAAGALEIAADAGALQATLAALLADPARRATMAAAGRAAWEAGRGVARGYADVVAGVLDEVRARG